MYKKILPLLFVFFSGKLFAFDFPIEITEYIDDVKITAYLNKSVLNEKSQWTPFESPPPLSIFDALQDVNEYLKANTAFANASLTGIELKQIPHHKTYWHYLVKIKTPVGDKSEPHIFVVLMTGKVISAIKRQGSIK